MSKLKNILLCATGIILLASCEDVIDLDLPEGRKQLVVDAFVSDEEKLQTINLTWTAGYFDNSLPDGVSGAEVYITGSDGSHFSFTEKEAGLYQYNAIDFPAIDSVDILYTLHIKYDNNEYISKSYLNPVPEIEQIGFYTELNFVTMEYNTFAEFLATDVPGRTDYYWIKSFVNDTMTGDVGSFRITRDASFFGSNTDGLMFDIFVRRSINDNEMPIDDGDEVRVELYSISESAWVYLSRINAESSNGGLFSVPPANIESNITDVAGQEQEEVLGVFSIMSVNTKTVVY